MNFTREPIIETIISPKEGHKLLVRNSRGSEGAEEFFVDAVEVVSFGQGYFFRSLERPKAFLVPVSDYEILEVKETRVALKNVSHERNIKIGGGREASLRHHRELPAEKERIAEPVEEEQQQPAVLEETHLETAISSRMEKRRDRRRRRHRRGADEQDWAERRPQEKQEPQLPHEDKAKEQKEGGGEEDEAKVSSPIFSTLIPPPTRLISETLSQYKETPEGKEVERKKEEKKKEHPPEDEASGSESSPLHRVAPISVTESVEISTFTSTHFSNPNDPFFY